MPLLFCNSNDFSHLHFQSILINSKQTTTLQSLIGQQVSHLGEWNEKKELHIEVVCIRMECQSIRNLQSVWVPYILHFLWNFLPAFANSSDFLFQLQTFNIEGRRTSVHELADGVAMSQTLHQMWVHSTKWKIFLCWLWSHSSPLVLACLHVLSSPLAQNCVDCFNCHCCSAPAFFTSAWMGKIKKEVSDNWRLKVDACDTRSFVTEVWMLWGLLQNKASWEELWY